jgi:hypothetical protein
MIIPGAILGSVVMVIQIVKYCILIRKRAKIKDYNLFVHETYTQYAKKTPAIILRIQDGYILQYNRFLKGCRFLSLFFKEMDYIGECPAKIVDLFKVNKPQEI